MATDTTITTEDVVELTGEQYIAAINELKSTTVSRDTYNKLKQENKQLLDSLVSGNIPEGLIPTSAEKKPTKEELRAKIASNKFSSPIEYAQTALDLRSAVMEEGGEDPFCTFSTREQITHQEKEDMAQVAELLEGCMDLADGDSGIFMAQLQKHLVDNYKIPRKK